MVSAAYYAHITTNFILNNYISQVKAMLSIRNENLSKILITLDPARFGGWDNLRCVKVGTTEECIPQYI